MARLFRIPEREPALPVVVPEERTECGNNLCHDRGNGKEGYRQPDDPEIDDHAGDRDRCKRCKLGSRLPVRIVEREVLVCDVTDYDTAAVREHGRIQVPDPKIRNTVIHQPDIYKR